MHSIPRLSIPHAPVAGYQKNFLRHVVCELKFPTLFEFDSPKPPFAFAQALRKRYPITQHATDVNVNGAGGAQSNVHFFRTMDQSHVVTLRPSSITLETTKYESFESFHEKLQHLVKVSSGIIDSNFFTRVGLRYINTMPWDPKTIRQWVRSDLVGVIDSSELGELRECFQRLSGPTENGLFFLQHGLGINTQTNQYEYVLDFDFSQENVELSNALELVRSMHKQEYDLFWWSLGPSAREALTK